MAGIKWDPFATYTTGTVMFPSSVSYTISGSPITTSSYTYAYGPQPTPPGMYFDRAGKPMTREAWAAAFENMDYRRVALTKLENSYIEVSTVWLGLNHNYNPKRPPLIFETMVFGVNRGEELDMERYATIQQAQAGHQLLVRKWQDKQAGGPVDPNSPVRELDL